MTDPEIQMPVALWTFVALLTAVVVELASGLGRLAIVEAVPQGAHAKLFDRGLTADDKL